MRLRPALLRLLLAWSCLGTTLAAERIETRIATTATPDQSYALYVPDGARDAQDGEPAARPLLIVLDPRGRGKKVLDQFVPAARERGWIVLSSYGSRSDTDEAVTGRALDALLREAARYPHDARRVYLAGMSGTAKTLWVVAPKLRGRVAGLLGSAAGRPPELAAPDAAAPPFFGTVGAGDYNFQEMRALEAELAQAGTPHRLQVFDGWHGWPPAGFADALAWFDLQAMRAGRAPRDEAFIDAQLATCRKDAEGTRDALDRWRAFDGCARDFDGLRDVAALRAEATRLTAAPAFARLRAQEQDLADDERRYVRRFNAWRERFSRRFNDGVEQPALALSESLRMLQVNALRKRAAAPDPRVAASARRQLAYAHVAASFYLRGQFDARGDDNRVAALEELADALAADIGG